MLLAIDIGNSNISVGLFDKAGKLLFLSSIDTDSRKTADQISIDLMNLFALYRYDLKDVTGAIFSSVVPPINFMMTKALTRLLGEPPMVVGPGRCFMKVTAHAETGAILGAQLMCPNASDIIGQLGQAIANGMTPGQLLAAMRPHPTYEEALSEALESLAGKL